MRYYAGIGSRETPEAVLKLMRDVAYDLACRGWTLRSGCAPGADSAFEEGAFDAYTVHTGVPKPELYLPWPRFQDRRAVLVAREEPQDEAFPIAEFFHPAWGSLKPAGRKFHARNVHQVLGYDVTAPQLVSFVLCWTKRAKGGGGTGQAIRIARHYGLPIYDLADPEILQWVQAQGLSDAA